MLKTNWELKAKICQKFGSQIDFALSNGLDPTFVSKIINGRRRLPESKKKQWAKWLECDPDEIWGNEKPKPKLIIRRG